MIPQQETPVKKHRKRATKKQIAALQLINQGMNKRKAMIKAGYSPTTANNPGKKLLEAQAITNIVDKFKLELQDEGLTTAYLAKKFMEWLSAQEDVMTQFGPLKDPETKEKITKPMYDVQIAAAKMLKDIYGLDPFKQVKSGEGQLSRKITLEEFIQVPNQSVNEVETIQVIEDDSQNGIKNALEVELMEDTPEELVNRENPINLKEKKESTIEDESKERIDNSSSLLEEDPYIELSKKLNNSSLIDSSEEVII